MEPDVSTSNSHSNIGYRKPQKRKRIVVSCTECHRRKQKCDRQYPCCNCIKRDAQTLCHYDTGPQDSQATRSRSGENAAMGLNGDMYAHNPAEMPVERPSEFQSEMRDFGYASHGSYSSMNLLRVAQLHGDQPLGLYDPGVTKKTAFRSQVGHRYKEIVRRLPSQLCIDLLVQTFFSEINWQYDIIDEESFKEQLSAWKRITYLDLQTGLENIALDTVVFPVILFQVLAHALLFHRHDETICSLMSIAHMTFHDLGNEYSDAGADLLALLGKEDITIAMIQAGLLRASFLKSSGKVIEAWHILGAAIRDAQEIGLHTGRVISGQGLVDPNNRSGGISLVGHKVWVVLHIWDIHMAVVLGRPIATNMQMDQFAHTIEDEEKRRDLLSHWRTESDSPRPFDIILAGYNVAYRYFKDIRQLEINGASSQDYPVVESVNAAIKKNLEILPSWCRLVNPDTKFDRLPECQWLSVARYGLSSLIHFVVLALHRPFIFSVARSRTEALKAGISILRAQERLFDLSEPRQRKVFNPVYASFDAIILITAVYIAFPDTDPKQRAECIEVVENGMERLKMIGQSNSMARSAHSVVCGLYSRLRHRLGISEPARSSTNPVASDGDVGREAQLELSFDAVSPPRPIHDLYYDHLSMVPISFTNAPESFPLGSLITDPTNRVDFEGDFSDASFWSLMNDLNN